MGNLHGEDLQPEGHHELFEIAQQSTINNRQSGRICHIESDFTRQQLRTRPG
jgi:hypothetical protein